jgi:hypothetical protein
MELNREAKLKLMRNLNWDYNVTPEEMLAVLEGALTQAGPFSRAFLFQRSLERLPWHYLIALWGVETAKELYTPELARRLWPKDLRSRYDFAFAVLRREPVSPTEWGSPRAQQLQNAFLSHRWYRT